MSRFAFPAVPPPFHHKGFRQTPLTPSESELESHLIETGPAGTGVDFDLGASPTLRSPSEWINASQPRRTSTLSYHHSGTGRRDTRERPLHRASRHLIVVLPPPDFPQEQRHLGHVLSLGPGHRLSQGIVMPLFPTMYGQLNAIAREFNFPSTAGLCLYLHTSENGNTTTPRISDESWQYLWGHLFETRPTSTNQQLPISGRIEFDIDGGKARWFDAWISASLRDVADTAEYTQELPHHWGGDSHTTEEHMSDQRSENPPVVQQSAWKNATRHVPRKLSLVDRLDSRSLASASKPPLQPNSQPPVQLTPVLSPIPQSAVPLTSHLELEKLVNDWRSTTTLAPTALVSAYQLSMEIPYTPASEPINDSPPDEVLPIEELNLDDFSWSISSVGPPSDLAESPLSPLSSFRPSSVHLDRRLEESVLLTPVTATSWGPDDDLASVVSDVVRLPSPDLGRRVVDDYPPTPSTGTSWGPLDDDRMSIVSNIIRLPSPDLGQRMVDDYPPTPSTATSWGVLDDDFKSIASSISRFPSPDLGQRMLEDPSDVSILTQKFATMFEDQRGYPSFKIYPDVYPHFDIFPAQAGEGVCLKDSQVVGSSNANDYGVRYPSFNIYPAVYPHFEIYPAVLRVDKDETSFQLVLTDVTAFEDQGGYPNFKIYPDVYPHFDIYPARAGEGAHSKDSQVVESPNADDYSSVHYPSFNIYPAVYPHFDIYAAVFRIAMDETSFQQVLVDVTTFENQRYPNLKIYPDVYPNFDIYPARAGEGAWLKGPPIVESSSNDSGVLYPSFNIYPAVYPHFNIYPALLRVDETSQPVFTDLDERQRGSMRLEAHYPWFDLYPSMYPFVSPYHVLGPVVRRPQRVMERIAQYPDFNIYPATGGNLSAETYTTHNLEYPTDGIKNGATISFSAPARYPGFNLYPSVYPFIKPYPKLSDAPVWPRNVDIPAISVTLFAQYPLFNLYPSVYPFVDPYPKLNNVASLYTDKNAREMPLIVRLQTTYPTFDLYPAVYPNLDVYPTVPGVTVALTSPVRSQSRESEIRTVNLKPVYPNFNLYPAVYPTFDLYPSILAVEGTSSVTSQQRITRELSPILRELPVTLPFIYPNISLYLRVYPDIEIYPPVSLKSQAREPPGEIHVGVHMHYPILVIYPTVYPYFDLYPSTWEPAAPSDEILPNLPTISLESKYPTFNIYPPVYPYFDLYPTICEVAVSDDAILFSVSINIESNYPMINLYPAVYPHFDLYPERPVATSTATTVREDISIYTRFKPAYPVFDLYPPVYPYFDLYLETPITADIATSVKENMSISTRLEPSYPIFVLYPPVYPYFDIYHSRHTGVADETLISSTTQLSPHYPVFELYPPVYPYFDIYHTRPVEDYSGVLHVPAISTLLPAYYPAFELYTPVYPFLEIYRSVRAGATDHIPSRRRSRKNHLDLVLSVMKDEQLSTNLKKKEPVQHKAHRHLHDEVFQDGVIWTPTGYAQDLILLSKKNPDSPTGMAHRSQHRTSRSRSGTVTYKPNVISSVPFLMNSEAISPSGIENTESSMTDSRSLGPRPIPLARSFGTLGSPSAVIDPQRSISMTRPSNGPTFLNLDLRRNNNVSATGPQLPLPTSPTSPVNRPRSSVLPARLPIRPVPNSDRDQATAKPAALHHRHRKSSLVQQRVRAYDQSVCPREPETPGNMFLTLSQFPMPTRPSLSSVSPAAKLDLSKSPFPAEKK